MKLDELINYIDELQKRCISMSKKDKRKKKEVEAILTITTLITIKAKEIFKNNK